MALLSNLAATAATVAWMTEKRVMMSLFLLGVGVLTTIAFATIAALAAYLAWRAKTLNNSGFALVGAAVLAAVLVLTLSIQMRQSRLNHDLLRADGQHVAFGSVESNLVGGDTGNYADVFVVGTGSTIAPTTICLALMAKITTPKRITLAPPRRGMATSS